MADADLKLSMQTNIYGDTALHSACYMGRIDAVKQLLPATGSAVLNMVGYYYLLKYRNSRQTNKF